MALSKPKTKAEFFKLETKTWRELSGLMRDLPTEAWLERGAAGSWTAKDVWTHIADWMIETRRRLPIMLRDAKPKPISIPKFNREHYTLNRKMSLGAAQMRVERERKKVLAFLKTLPKEQLINNKRIYSWASFSTFNHYDEHMPPLRTFRRSILKAKKR